MRQRGCGRWLAAVCVPWVGEAQKRDLNWTATLSRGPPPHLSCLDSAALCVPHLRSAAVLAARRAARVAARLSLAASLVAAGARRVI